MSVVLHTNNVTKNIPMANACQTVNGFAMLSASSSSCVDVMSVTVVRMTVARLSLNRAYSVSHQRKLRRHKLKGP